MKKIFNVGDKIYKSSDYAKRYSHHSRLLKDKIYTVKEFYLGEDIGKTDNCVVLEEIDQFNDAFHGGFIADRFELVEEVKVIQDNEFVKMMCSNERMLDIP